MYLYDLENVWQNKSLEVKEEIIDFWLAERAVPRQFVHDRVNQVFFVARDMENKIIGVNTVYMRYNTQLENHLYYYRTFIGKRARGSQMVVEMLLTTRDYFETRYVETKKNEPIGIFLEVENNELKTRLNQAIWPGSNFIFIGKNERGDHLRVYYFKNAVIS